MPKRWKTNLHQICFSKPRMIWYHKGNPPVLFWDENRSCLGRGGLLCGNSEPNFELDFCPDHWGLATNFMNHLVILFKHNFYQSSHISKHLLRWPPLAFSAWKSLNIRSYTVHSYGSGQPYKLEFTAYVTYNHCVLGLLPWPWAAVTANLFSHWASPCLGEFRKDGPPSWMRAEATRVLRLLLPRLPWVESSCRPLLLLSPLPPVLILLLALLKLESCWPRTLHASPRTVLRDCESATWFLFPIGDGVSHRVGCNEPALPFPMPNWSPE